MSILLKAWSGTKTFFFIPIKPFTTAEITGCTSEAVKRANKAPRSPPLVFLFHGLVFQ